MKSDRQAVLAAAKNETVAFSMVRLPDLAKDRLTVPVELMERFAKGNIVYRVHLDIYSPAGGVIRLNNSDRGNARFSPIRDRAGKIIPTLYAGVLVVPPNSAGDLSMVIGTAVLDIQDAKSRAGVRAIWAESGLGCLHAAEGSSKASART